MKPISGRTKLITVIGDPIEHSLSPQIHNRALEKDELDYRYLAFDILPDQVPAYLDAMRTMGIVGTNVTMPDNAPCSTTSTRSTRSLSSWAPATPW